MKLFRVLEETLKKENDYLSDDGELKKWVVINKAQNFDAKLLELLMSNDELKAKFFVDVKGVLCFNQNLFIQFLEQKDFLKDSYTQFKNKIGLTIDGKYLQQRNEVALVWPYKDCVLEGGQSREEDKRDEIFFNETLAQDEITQLLEPKVFTNAKKYTEHGEEQFEEFTRDETGTIKDNLIIKGNNLLALHSLKKEFSGKVKLIYIDPPYNPASDKNSFSYNNSFNHSTWLTFIRNRLEIARSFLTKDGFITIAIDHNELFYLGALADEVFDRENRIAVVTVLHNPKGRNQAEFFSENSEFLLVYANNLKEAQFNQVAIDDDVLATFDLEDKKGKYRWENYVRARTVWSRQNKPKNWYPIYVSPDLKTITSESRSGFHELFPITNQGEFAWKNVQPSFVELNKDDYFKAEQVNGKIQLFHKYYEQQVIKNVWTDKKYQSEFQGTNLLKKLIGENSFSYPKSLYAVVDVIKLMTVPGDIILDFFGGSGTTAHAVYEINFDNPGKRSFVSIEQLDEHINVTLRRMKKIIADSNATFVYFEPKKYNQHFAEKVLASDSTRDLLKIWEEIKSKSFVNYNIDFKRQDEQIEEFRALTVDEQKRHLIEILDKNQLYVNLSSLDDEDFAVSDEEKKITKDFYGLS